MTDEPKQLSPQYLAGLFDGEGCVSLTVSGKSRRVIVRVSIVNTDENILNLLKNQLGGMMASRQNPDHPDWKMFRSITWGNNTAEHFLKLIEPYSIIKSRQIKLALEFLEFKKQKEGRFVDGLTPRKDNPKCLRFVRKLAPEVIIREQQYKNMMHDLNRKGQVVN